MSCVRDHGGQRWLKKKTGALAPAARLVTAENVKALFYPK
jgi:hypothetical protein